MRRRWHEKGCILHLPLISDTKYRIRGLERLYAVRLDQLRKLPEAETLLAGLDTPGLLKGSALTNSNSH